MWRSARIKLTIWYLLIIVFISGFFSVLVYRSVISELEYSYIRIENRLRLDQNKVLRLRPMPMMFYEDLELAKHEVAKSLLVMNWVILLGSAIASYLLAGRSLEPLELAMERQKRFIGDASHELRTPIAAMRTSMEVALRSKKRTKKNLGSVMQESLDELKNLQRLTDSLLNFSKYGEGELEFELLRLKPILGNVIKRIKPLAQRKSIKIVQTLDNAVILGHRLSIEQLLLILIDNAVKYSSKGGKIVVDAKHQRQSIEINIADNGPGITKKDMKRVFDRFYRSDNARTRSTTHGFGLGLSLAKRIVDNNSGSIKIKSKHGNGTTVTVRLPIEQK